MEEIGYETTIRAICEYQVTNLEDLDDVFLYTLTLEYMEESF